MIESSPQKRRASCMEFLQISILFADAYIVHRRIRPLMELEAASSSCGLLVRGGVKKRATTLCPRAMYIFGGEQVPQLPYRGPYFNAIPLQSSYCTTDTCPVLKAADHHTFLIPSLTHNRASRTDFTSPRSQARCHFIHEGTLPSRFTRAENT